MSSRVMAAALLLLTAQLVAAADWRSFAADSGRGDDSAILEALSGGDFEIRMAICQGIGTRAEPFAADIIDYLRQRGVRQDGYRASLLLRVLLDGMFNPARGEAEMRARVAANKEILMDIAARIGDYRDPQLTATLVRILPLLPSDTALPALMVVGSRLTSELQRNQGVIPSQEIDLVLGFLSTAARMKSQDLLDPCVVVARLSREKVVVDAARKTVKTLLAQ
jgi:hypothetical protein